MVRSPVLALHLFGCERTKRSGLAPERHQSSISREGCRDKEGNCNILYHSLPFARICAGTHLSILAVTAFVSIVRRSLLRAFHSLVSSSTARLSSLVTHTVAGHSSACVALVSEVHGVWARGSRERIAHRQQRQQQRGRLSSRRLTQRRRRSNIGGGRQQYPRSNTSAYTHMEMSHQGSGDA